MYAIITASIFDLHVLGDLMMCILFYDDQQEHKLDYKENIHLILLFVLQYYHVFLMYIFKCMVCTNAAPGFIFCALSLIYIQDEFSRNDLKVTGGVETFVY